MKQLIKNSIIFLILVATESTFSQNSKEMSTFSFEEYIAYVKQHNPLMKKANLRLSLGEATLLKAKGGFDPKIAVDYERKKFKETEYFDQLSSTFKIPTWYGVGFNAKYEENTGAYLNPNLKVPDGGLYSAGVSLSLAQGLLINERMASLKKAKFFMQQTHAERDVLVNELLYNASKAYFKWLSATNEVNIYKDFLQNAQTRLNAVEKSVAAGDKAKIDITEARITFYNRQLNLEAVLLKEKKTSLEASNYLWVNDIPLEINEAIKPINPGLFVLEEALVSQDVNNTKDAIAKHPKILSYDAKIKSLQVDRSLKKNKLFPKINVQYNFLSNEFNQVNTFNTGNYKAFVNFSVPIFLRKERGDLKLARLKLQEKNFERTATSLYLQNKIGAVKAEIRSLSTQNSLITNMVNDYKMLVKAEERKFLMGESSLFLINSREQKLMDARLKENTLLIKQLNAKASLHNALGY